MTYIRTIAIDFDGCLCEDRWPEIGPPNDDVIAAALRERAAGSKLILWTCRTGRQLEEAVAWCADHGLTFDAVNAQIPELADLFGPDSRKVFATEYWDDRARRMPEKK